MVLLRPFPLLLMMMMVLLLLMLLLLLHVCMYVRMSSLIVPLILFFFRLEVCLSCFC